MRFTSYLFDYNGVLVDDEQVHLDAFRDVLTPLGIELSEAAYWERYLGFDDVGAFRAVLTDHGLAASDVTVASLVAQKGPCYLQRARGSLKGFPEAGRVLRELSAEARLGIVSGALRPEIELGLEVLEASAAVSFIVSAEDTQACKPAPEGYLLGLAALRAIDAQLTERCLVIEDSLAGIESARAAGLPCLAIAHSYDASVLRAAGAVRVLPRLAELTLPLLETLSRELYG